ncbi:hypothetical protein ACFY3M_48635 [Streptomyces mirabilis]|uniref:hypothetical protein n=1 Tax=Streptomyces mirabilis TaxID=68239 RepID=UPI0036789651
MDTSGDPAFTALLRRVRAADLAAYRAGTAALARPGGIALSVLTDSGEAYEAAGLTVRAAPPLLPLRAAALGLILTERHTPAGAPAGIAVTAAYQYDAVGETAAAPPPPPPGGPRLCPRRCRCRWPGEPGRLSGLRFRGGPNPVLRVLEKPCRASQALGQRRCHRPPRVRWLRCGRTRPR